MVVKCLAKKLYLFIPDPPISLYLLVASWGKRVPGKVRAPLIQSRPGTVLKLPIPWGRTFSAKLMFFFCKIFFYSFHTYKNNWKDTSMFLLWSAAITKPPLFRRNKLTGSGNPAFESCVEVKAQQR